MVECHKGEMYGNGLLIDFGEAFDKQSERVDQEATFGDCREVSEYFFIGDDGNPLVIKGCVLHLER